MSGSHLTGPPRSADSPTSGATVLSSRESTDAELYTSARRGGRAGEGAGARFAI